MLTSTLLLLISLLCTSGVQADCPDGITCDAIYPLFLNADAESAGEESVCTVDRDDGSYIEIVAGIWYENFLCFW